MAAVLLTILKIIGIVLLAVIALVLIIAALLLFVPIRYRIKADKDENSDSFSAEAKVTYLLHIISAAFVYDGGTDFSVRIFGIKAYPKKKKKKKRKKENADSSENEALSENAGTDAEPSENSHSDIPDEDDFTIDWNDDGGYGDNEHTEGAGADDKESLSDKIAAFAEKIKEKYESACDKYKGLKSNIHFWKKMAEDEKNKEALRIVKSQVIRFLRKIAPKRVKGFIHFGSEDPATTGKILMYLSLIYPVLPKKLTIDPGFEDTDIYGNILIKGHIALIVPVMCFLKLYFSRECRRMWRLYKKHSGK